MKSDLELVEEVRSGNKSAFAVLVERHQRGMMRVAVRMTRDVNSAEDVVQDSLIKAFKNIGTFVGRASFRSWLYQITLNTTKNKLRSQGREVIGVDQLTLAVDEGTERRLIDVDIKQLIRQEVAKLPQRQQMALNLRIFEDLSFKEIAEIMECPYDTAKANYRHGLMKLKQRLENELNLQQWQGAEPQFWIESATAVEVDG